MIDIYNAEYGVFWLLLLFRKRLVSQVGWVQYLEVSLIRGVEHGAYFVQAPLDGTLYRTRELAFLNADRVLRVFYRGSPPASQGGYEALRNTLRNDIAGISNDDLKRSLVNGIDMQDRINPGDFLRKSIDRHDPG